MFFTRKFVYFLYKEILQTIDYNNKNLVKCKYEIHNLRHDS